MFFRIEHTNGVAVYEQISRQVKFAIAVGTLREGDMIASVRELARELDINPNTVARAYRELQQEGVLESVRGTGLVIADQARRLCREARREILADRMGQVVNEAIQGGLSPEEIEKLLQTQLRRMSAQQERTR